MKIVLHICCGVCAGGVAERLASEGHQVIGLYYNPNIYPYEEYEKRLDAARKVAEELKFPLEEGPYNPEEWLNMTNPLANEPEGGKRCEVCFRLRLEKTYHYLQNSEFDAFTTTLTVSPHKNTGLINRIGHEIGGENFLSRDFKKQAGFQRTTELAKKWHIYHQDYCGCMYSMRVKRKG